MTCMGVSAGLLASCEKERLEPGREQDLSALRASARPARRCRPRAFRWVYEHVDEDVWLFSTSGGTDVCTAFVGGLPAAARLRGRTAVPRARLRASRPGTSRATRLEDEVGELVDHRADAVDAAVPVERRRRRAAARELLLDVPRASGATATGSASRRAAAPSSTAARTRRSTARACAWARARSTAPRRAVEEVLDALVVDVGGPGSGGALGDELRMILFVVLRDGRDARRGAGSARSRRASARTARRATSPTRSARSRRCRARSRARCSRCPVKRILMGAPPSRPRASTRSRTRVRSTTSSSSPRSWRPGESRPPARLRRADGCRPGRRHRPSERPDDLLHDLVRAAVDARHARVGVGARDRVLEHVAVAAVQLQAAVDDAALQLGAPPLRHRRRPRASARRR